VTTVLTGVQTSNANTAVQVRDVDDKVFELQPDEAQFRILLGRLGSKDAVARKVEWVEDELMPRVSTLATSATSADTALTVSTGEGNTVFRVNDVVRNTLTLEAYLVTSVSANSIGVVRGWGDKAAASSDSGAQLMIVANVSAEYAGSGTARVVEKVVQFNYLTDERHQFAFSDVETAIEMYSGREPETEQQKKLVEHTRAIESGLFFGARDLDTNASPGPRGSAGGLLEFITTNVENAQGALTPAEFDTFLEGPFGVGSMNKVLFVAPRVATVLSQMYRDKWQPTEPGNNRLFGAHVNAFLHSTYGTSIPVIVKREWQDLSKTGTGFGTYAFLVDLDYVKFRPLRGFNTKLRMNIEPPDVTGVVHEYRTVYSFELAQEKAHGIMKGITSYSAT
jgi:hypothetical protein